MTPPLVLALAVAAALVVVELATSAATHPFTGGFALFGVAGALVIASIAKALGAGGLQRDARPEDPDG